MIYANFVIYGVAAIRSSARGLGANDTAIFFVKQF